MKLTPLHDLHVQTGARMTEFVGRELPLSYGSVIDEVNAVRQRAGLFDVSHMGRIEVIGRDALQLLQRVTTNDVARLEIGRGQYSLMCNGHGGIIDDLTIFRTGAVSYLLIVNAANTSKDFEHLAVERSGHVTIQGVTAQTVLFALQGPMSAGIMRAVAGGPFADMSHFACGNFVIAGIGSVVCRAGYTGELGYEIRCSAADAIPMWEALLAAGPGGQVVACGLAARDILRLEAGYVLYGHEIDEDTDPIQAGLIRFVRMDKGGFMGRAAIEAIPARGPERTLSGIRMADRTVPRSGVPVLMNGENVGAVTSGTFSPTIKRGIALGYLKTELNRPGLQVEVVLREKPHAGLVVQPPFY